MISWIKEKWNTFKKWIIGFFVGGTVLASTLVAVDNSVLTEDEFIVKKGEYLTKTSLEFTKDYQDLFGDEIITRHYRDKAGNQVSESMPRWQMKYDLRKDNINVLRADAIQRLISQFCSENINSKECPEND